ncbi:hypothetical protein [Endozoicomonas sp. GU-1]|uniref:hypothetical protein n=1 Tax=Endozoicomonas sp. GU-1 TaxID=3009078 RepID=UPI0022B393ED|nr:hypothetical protein [Endozoicomonas sp. GU-1]WBA80731.1 hypothetical protein O2T12_20810 [Endozoicomonas sp. GU-1]WBA88297.1 hypothetical protein O3276_10025 [Endozoicomonas sp. GU-1]
MDGASEDIALAVEIIRQLENLNYPEENILKAMIHICQDTLNKLPNDGTREFWRQRLIAELLDSSNDTPAEPH